MELYKGWGASMGLENTAKTWEGRRHGLTMALGPMLGSRNRNGKRVKDRMEMMDLLGCRVVKTVE